MPHVKFGRKEADLLAIRPTDGRRLHVEVSVSSRPWGSIRAVEDYRREAAEYLEKKFTSLHDDVSKILGATDFQRWLVIGNLAGGHDEEYAWKSRMLEDDVIVIRFNEVVRQYVKNFKSRPVGLTGDLLDVLNELGLLKLDS
jgi:hypothetical protein